MIDWNLFPGLLAQAENRFLEMGRNFREAEQNFRWTNVLLVVAVPAVVALITWLLVRYFKSRDYGNYHHPGRLFRELCRAHQLDRTSRHLLSQLAKERELAHPAVLFVEPRHFELHGLNDHWQSRQPTLAALREQIFA